MGFRTAPRRCAAWKSTAASARLGSKDETTSPGRTPRAASPAATRSASRPSSAYVSRTRSSTSAVFSACAAACPRSVAVKDIRGPSPAPRARGAGPAIPTGARRPSPPREEVEVVLGREADRAVHLVRVHEEAPERLAPVRDGRAHRERPLAPRLQAPGRLVDEMAERVEVGPHVDTAVRDGLEAADRLAELVAGPGVVHRHGEGPLGRAG